MSALLGQAVGLLDLGFGRVHKHKLLEGGWGEEALRKEEELSNLLVDEGSRALSDVADFAFLEEKDDGEVSQRLAAFTSPCAPWLPEESKTGYAMVVEPSKTDQPLQGIVVQISATGEEGFSSRLEKVARPLARAGYASILPQIPFYGRRRPPGQTAFFVRTFGDFLLQAPATILEGAKLAKLATELFPGVPLCLSGTSFGGAAAAGAFPSLYRELERNGTVELPLAISTFVAPARHMPMLTTVFQDLCRFDTLTSDGGEGFASEDEARSRIRSILEQRDFDRLFRLLAQNYKPQKVAFTCTRAKHDHCIPVDESQLIYNTTAPYATNSRLVDVNGGHLWNIWRAQNHVPGRIRETFAMLELPSAAAKVGVRALHKVRI